MISYRTILNRIYFQARRAVLRNSLLESQKNQTGREADKDVNQRIFAYRFPAKFRKGNAYAAKNNKVSGN